MILDIAIIFLLIHIFIQDWKHRAVYWFIFPVVAILGITKAYFSNSLSETLCLEWLMSFAFLAINSIVLILYIKGKNSMKETSNEPLNYYIGLGDLFFFVTLIFFGTFIHFIVFYTASLALSLIIWLIVKRFSKHEHVPLAGLQAVCLLVVWLMSIITKYSSYQDGTLLHYISN